MYDVTKNASFIIRKQPSNNDDWLTLLKHQEALHSTETTQWQHILQAAIDLLRKVRKETLKIERLL